MKRRLTELPGRVHRYGKANPNIPQSLAAFVIKLLGAALSFGFSFLIARHFGAAGSGTIALVQTTAQFGSLLALVGLDYVLLRAMAGDLREGKPALARGAARSALRITTIGALLIGGALAFFGEPALHMLLGRDLGAAAIYLAAAAVLPLTLNRMAVVSLRGSGSVLMAQWLEGPQAMVIAVSVLAGVIVAGMPIGTSGVLLLYFGTIALSAVAAWLLYRRKASHWPSPEPAPVGPMLAQSWRISFVIISRFVIDWLVLVTLGSLYSVFEVGQFRTAWQVSALITLIVSTFDTVAGPRIAAAWRVRDVPHIHQVMRQSVATMMLISAPLLIATLVFPEWILGLFGPEFVPAAGALRILALGQLVNILAGPVGTVLLMTGEERVSFIISLVALVVLGVLCFTLIPAFGLIGAAVTTTLIILLRTGVTWGLVQKQLKTRES